MGQHQRWEDSTPWSSRHEMRRRRRRRPELEGLESRQLLTTLNDSYALSGNAGPEGITAGPNDQLWFADTTSNQVQSITTSGTLGTPITVGVAPEGIVYVPGGDIWFTESGANAIGRINPATGQYLGDFQTPTSNSGPQGITYDSANGLIYFTEGLSGKIGFFNPATITSGSDIQEKTLSNASGGPDPDGITYDPGDGDVWFTENGTNQIGMFSPSGQSFNTYTLPNASSHPGPTQITVGSDSNLWFSEYGTGTGFGLIDMFNPTSNTFAANGPYTLPASAHNPTAPIIGITSGPDGDIYFTAGVVGQVGWFNPATVSTSSNPSQDITVLNVPNSSAAPYGIAPGPDGNVWFTETDGATGNGSIGVADLSTHLSIATQPPSSVTAGTGFGLTADVAYDTGVVDPDFDGQVTVSLANNPGGSTLGGSHTVTASKGVAAFSDLSLNNTGSGYILQVSANGLASTTTNSFNVTTSPSPTSPSPSPTSPSPSPTSPSPSPTSPSPSPTSPTPTIIAEQISAVHLRHNKKGRPIGQAVEEIVLTFSTAMNSGAIGNAGNYQVGWTSTRKVKRKVQTSLHPMPVVSTTVAPSGTVVTLVTSATAKKFAKGGQLTIVSPGSVQSAAGVSLGAPTVFTISPRAGGISPSS
jgi:streptogramin lyase